MIIPNTQRVLIKRIVREEDTESGLIIPGQLKAGENLFFGEIIHPGDTHFKKGQKVYYSEYSAATLIDVGAVLANKITMGQAISEKNVYFVVAEDDIMAYEEDEVTN